jgi:crotonobetainyl-CoA:carnitine CoA-transferase CaiB-like acyl-CoA transferase
MQDVAPAMGAVPALGEHSKAILEELAFDQPTIARWVATGVV